MGQQQLILLVLSTVIVGIAIVVGIRAFNENAIKSNSDAMIQDMVRIASDAQAWKQKPAPFGGQPEGSEKQDPMDYTGATLPALGYAVNNGDAYVNQNGGYTIVGDDTGLTIVACNEIRGNKAALVVTGITDADIIQDANELELGGSGCTVPTGN